MSDTRPGAVPTVRSRGRWRRFVGAACTVCVLALFVALTLWSARPRWYTFVSRQIRSSPAYRLVVRVPAGWECVDEGDTPDCAVISMHPEPPVGLAQWWQRHVLHTGVTQASEEQGTVDLIYTQVAASNSDSDYFRFLASGILESVIPTCRRTYAHPLGPALERTYGQEGAVHDYMTRIVVRQHPKGQRLEVIAGLSGASANLSRIQPEWEQIVHSIRIMQK